MAPIVAVLLHVRDVDGFVATFVTMYTGLIPMFSTAGNTTNNGLVGALLTDRFCNYPKPEEPALSKTQNAPASFADQGSPLSLSKLVGWILMAMGAWMIVSPQAVLGLDQLKWMYKYAFPGEVLLGALLMTGSLQLLNPNGVADQISPVVQKIPPTPESTSTPTSLT
jgi:hypothetical protein